MTIMLREELILILPAPIGRRTLDVALRSAVRVTALPGATALRCEFDLPRRMRRVEKADKKERAQFTIEVFKQCDLLGMKGIINEKVLTALVDTLIAFAEARRREES